MRETCADCGDRPASVFLPEGRYLCRHCWHELSALRAYVTAPEWRRRRLAASRGRIVAVTDTTGTVAL